MTKKKHKIWKQDCKQIFYKLINVVTYEENHLNFFYSVVGLTGFLWFN